MFPNHQNLFLLFLFIKNIHSLSFKECRQAAADTFVAIENNCLGYIYCRGDESVTGLCPAGTYFDQETQQCAVDTLLKCADYAAAIAEEVVQQSSGETQLLPVLLTTPQYGQPNKTSTSAAEVSTELTSQLQTTVWLGRPHCNSTLDEYYPYKLHCEYYYKCWRGYLSILRCSFGHGWDFLLQKCVTLKDAQCYKVSE